MSISWRSDAAPRARLLVLPPDADSLDEAHAAIELWEHYSRKTLDETQRLAVEVMMAESGGRWAARTTGREMPRQNGKGDELETVELWGLVQRGEAILHTAHELTTVSSAHQRMVGLVEGHADLRRRKVKILNGIGQQLIEMKGGGVAAYRTRTNGGGRGLDDISRLIIDEAQHAKPEQLASSTPILLANPNPQMNFAGTGAIAGVSDWWWQLRKRALGSDPGQFGYVGHTAEVVYIDDTGKVVQEPVNVEDRSLWPSANPALVYGRGELGFFEEQLRTLGPALFAREHLGVWDPPPIGADGLLIPNWHQLVDGASEVASHRCLALDVAPDLNWAAIGGAGRRADGLFHVENVWSAPRTGWVKAECVRRSKATGCPIRILTQSPAAAFMAPLREAGVVVVEVSAQEHAAALGQFLMAAAEDQLRHLGQTSLTSALAAAVVRQSGEVDLWARRQSGGDISPLVAVTVALGGIPAVVDVVGNVW